MVNGATCGLLVACVTGVHCQVYWRVVDRLMPRTTEPRDLSTVLAAVEGRIVCPADNRLCTLHLVLIDNEVLTQVTACYRQLAGTLSVSVVCILTQR